MIVCAGMQARIDCQVLVAVDELIIRWSSAGLVVKERCIPRAQILSVEYVYFQTCGLCINVEVLMSSSAYKAMMPLTGPPVVLRCYQFSHPVKGFRLEHLFDQLALLLDVSLPSPLVPPYPHTGPVAPYSPRSPHTEDEASVAGGDGFRAKEGQAEPLDDIDEDSRGGRATAPVIDEQSRRGGNVECGGVIEREDKSIPTSLGKDVHMLRRQQAEQVGVRTVAGGGDVAGNGVGGGWILEGQNKIVCAPRRMLVVVNPISGNRRGAEVWETVAEFFRAGKPRARTHTDIAPCNSNSNSWLK